MLQYIVFFSRMKMIYVVRFECTVVIRKLRPDFFFKYSINESFECFLDLGR